MSVYGSMQYTIGTALQRARDAGHLVEVLVEGQWIAGTVVASDGIGVVLDNQGLEHCIVRLENVAAVRVVAETPVLENGPQEGAVAPNRSRPRAADEAMPMPGPQRVAV